MYAAKERYGVDEREIPRSETRCHEEGDRVNELPFCGLPGVFFLLIGMRAGVYATARPGKGKIGGDDITADRRIGSFGFGVEKAAAAAEGERVERHRGARGNRTPDT